MIYFSLSINGRKIDPSENQNLAYIYNHVNKLELQQEIGYIMTCFSLIEIESAKRVKIELGDNQFCNQLITGPNSPLGKIHNAALFLAAKGLISSTDYTLLQKLKTIRNHFAHTYSAALSDEFVLNAFRSSENHTFTDETPKSVSTWYFMTSVYLALKIATSSTNTGFIGSPQLFSHS